MRKKIYDFSISSTASLSYPMKNYKTFIVLKRLWTVKNLPAHKTWYFGLEDEEFLDIEVLSCCQTQTVRNAGQTLRKKLFLYRIVTGDEKWIHYNNTSCKKSYVERGQPNKSTTIPNIHDAKVMFSILWDQESMLYYVAIIFHHESRIARPVKNYLENSGWEVLPRPLYSLDLASSDY